MQQTGASELAKKNAMFNFISFMDLLVTNQSLSLASAGSTAQVTPTSPERLSTEYPEGRRGVTADALGDRALLPIIVPFSS